MADSASARALNVILPQISTAPYEAHQKARTFASRYVKSGQYDTAIDVLFQSSCELLKSGQTGSGVDLARFLIDVYGKKGLAVTDESRARLTQLIALTGPENSWRKALIDNSVAWSAKHSAYPSGDPVLQHYVGHLLYKDGMFEAAEPYLLASGTRESARLLAEMFIKWGQETASYGVFAVRGIIPYLQNGNILAARTFIEYITSSSALAQQTTTITVGDDEVKMTDDALINFSQLAVLTCQRAQGDKNKVTRECWVRLCGTYRSHGNVLASPEVRAALNEIASLFFAIPPPRNQATNPLGDMISSLFGGGSTPLRVLSPNANVTSGLD